jgi:iron-sulfur cluster assembly protein
LVITQKAQDQLNHLLEDGEFLEIGLKGGGCNGLMITLEKMNSTGITELSIGNNTRFADQMSQTYLQGGSLDYEDTGFSKTFVVNPSKGTRRCGCGNSIALPEV